MKNRIRLADRLGGKGYHSSIVSTFGIDFDAYESIVLPRLKGANCRNNLLLVDARMLTHALDGESDLPRSAGKDYSVVGCAADRVFHPKIILQIGRRSARLIVSSANITAPGLGGNLEVAGIVDICIDDVGERQLAAAALNFLLRHLQSTSEVLRHQTNWLQRRCQWITETALPEGSVELNDGTQAAFLTSGGEVGIGTRFIELVGKVSIRRLIVLSPYWDSDLRALRYLVDQLQPAEALVLVDIERELFPKKALEHLPNLKILNIRDQVQQSFAHAKVFIAQTETEDHLLFGSANCTVAALGLSGYVGANEEASLYRCLPANDAIKALELKALLDTAMPVLAASLPEQRLDESIPLEHAASRFPGSFELQGDILNWWLPKGCKSETVTLEFLNSEGTSLEVSIQILVREDAANPRRIRLLDLAQQPAFARLRYPTGETSAPAVITVAEDIFTAVREVQGKKTEELTRKLSDSLEEELWFLEAAEILETADLDLPPKTGNVAPTRTSSTGHDGQPADFASLPYEAFVATRHQQKNKLPLVRNELAGTSSSLIQACLNRILGIGHSRMESDNCDDTKAARRAFDLGDETDSADGAIENGSYEASPIHKTASTTPQTGEDERPAGKALLDAAQFVLTVRKHIQKVWDRAKSHQLTSFDVLRLRAALMVIAAVSTSDTQHELLTTKPISRNQGPSRLLPVNGDRSWITFICNLLFTFFGGKDPAIQYLQIPQRHEQIPADIQECWATAAWAIHVCRLASPSLGAHSLIAVKIPEFTDKLYARLGLSAEELTAPLFMQVIEALNHRFSVRLGYDSSRLIALHQEACSKIA